MARIIAVTGGKGGVGKTNISVNLSLCLSELGSKVCLFDADLGLANINILLGLYPEYNLEDVILGNKSIQDIAIKDYHGIDIIPGSSGVEKIANLEQKEMDRFISTFSDFNKYDFFIIDTSAGISKNVASFCLAASEIILVITPEPTSLTDAYALLKVLCLNGFEGSAKVVLNQCENTKAASLAYNRFKGVVQKYLSVDIVPLGIIVQDSKFPEAVRRQQPLIILFPESSASKCIRVMASRLKTNESEDFKPAGITSFWTKFLEFSNRPLSMKEKDETTGKNAIEENISRNDKTEKKRNSPAVDTSIDTQLQQNSAGNISPATPHEKPGTVSGGGNGQKDSSFAEKPGADHALLDKMMLSNLPTLPHILVKLNEVCSSEDASINDLGEVVRQDPSLSTKIMSMVNTAHLSFSQKITNFNHALSILGFDTIRNIVISSSVHQVFDSMKEVESFNMKRFWCHSLMCAIISELIAKKTSYPQPEEAFMAGLMHDIGKLVILKNCPDKYQSIIGSSENSSGQFSEEEKLFGFTHCDTGARLTHHWDMKSFIGDAILYHHEPLHRIVNALPLVKIVYLANNLCFDVSSDKKSGSETAENVLNLKPADIKEIFGLAQSDTDEIVVLAGEQTNQIAQSLGIDVELPSEKTSNAAPEKNSDGKMQDELASHVRDMALVLGTLQNLTNAHDMNSILLAARQGIQVLFNTNNILFFIYDESANILSATDGNSNIQNNLTDELTIPFKDGKSIIVTALQQGDITDSFSCQPQSDLTIIDEQVIRLTGKKGILCFPMTARREPVGVVVMGLDEDHVSSIKNRNKLMGKLISHAAFTLLAEKTRQLHAKRILAERLSASATIAKRVAHEVNNPLSIIKNYLKILEMNLSDRDIPAEEIKIINSEIDRVANTVEELSDMSKPRPLHPEPVEINGLLRDIAALYSETLKQNSVSLHLDPDAALPSAVTDKNSLKQIFVNLLKNAFEAQKNGGNIWVSTTYHPDYDSIEIKVRDDGAGLPDIIKSKLFEPYATTKGAGHAGLGLSIVYSTVKALRGNVTCTTEKDMGTTFKIVLPVSVTDKHINGAGA